MTNRIHHELFFPHPAEQVWEYLTQAELIEHWLMKNNFQLIPGFQFEFRSDPAPSIDFDGIIYCTLLEILPYKKLSYSWKFGPGKGKITVDSLVVWRLHQKDGGTLLELEHTGFKEIENVNIFSAMEKGWLKHITTMLENINAQEHGSIHP